MFLMFIKEIMVGLFCLFSVSFFSSLRSVFALLLYTVAHRVLACWLHMVNIIMLGYMLTPCLYVVAICESVCVCVHILCMCSSYAWSLCLLSGGYFFLENEGGGREEAHRRIVCQFINLICNINQFNWQGYEHSCSSCGVRCNTIGCCYNNDRNHDQERKPVCDLIMLLSCLNCVCLCTETVPLHVYSTWILV